MDSGFRDEIGFKAAVTFENQQVCGTLIGAVLEKKCG